MTHSWRVLRITIHPVIMVRAFGNGPRDLGSIPSGVILETQKKWYLMLPCLALSIIIRYVSRVKLSNPEKGVAPSPTPRCSSYWKGCLRVTLDYVKNTFISFLKYLIDHHIFFSMFSFSFDPFNASFDSYLLC